MTLDLQKKYNYLEFPIRTFYDLTEIQRMNDMCKIPYENIINGELNTPGCKGYVVNGERHGKWWFRISSDNMDGDVICNYYNGILEGYYEDDICVKGNMIVKQMGHLKNGMKDGLWKTSIYLDHNDLQKGIYKQGKLIKFSIKERSGEWRYYKLKNS